MLKKIQKIKYISEMKKQKKKLNIQEMMDIGYNIIH